METTINSLIKLGEQHKLINTNDISDGYHTFGELYAHRVELYIALCKMITYNKTGSVHPVWRSRAHSDGTFMKGWFLMGIYKEHGRQITYHLPEAFWIKCEFAETLKTAPFYDEHTSADVLKRLSDL